MTIDQDLNDSPSNIGCFSKDALMLYAMLNSAVKKPMPVDGLLKEILGFFISEGVAIPTTRTIEKSAIINVSRFYDKHLTNCGVCQSVLLDCAYKLDDKARAFEKYVQEKLGRAANHFLEMRMGFLFEHLGLNESNELFRYMDRRFFTGFGKIEPISQFEKHIRSCGYCLLYKGFGDQADLWGFHYRIE